MGADSTQKPLSVILDEIEERANKATPGPWEVDNWDTTIGPDDGSDVLLVITKDKTGNAPFIASARTDVPALVKALRKATEWFDIIENLNAPGKGAFGEKIEATTEYFYARRAKAAITAILNQGRSVGDNKGSAA